MKSFLLLFIIALFVTVPVFGADIPQNMTALSTPAPFAAWTNSGWPAGNNAGQCWQPFDGNDGTPVSPNCQMPGSGVLGENNYIAVDLGALYTIKNFTVYSTYTVGSGLGTSKYYIQGSTDNVSWSHIWANTTNDSWTTKRTYTLPFGSQGVYRYYRITNLSIANDHIIQTLYFGVDTQTAPYLNVTLQNLLNGSLVNSFNYLVVSTNTTNSTQTGYCAGSSCYVTNYTGTVNLTIYNISGDTYYNVTVNNISFTNNMVQTVQVYQSLLNITTQQLFTNATINSFSVNNSQVTNTTTTGSLLLPAIVGANNLLSWNSTGNYTKNQTCTVTSALTTTSCNITGIYDNLFTIGARQGSTSVSNFTITVRNATLGGVLYNQTTTNGSIIFPLLQNYQYQFNIFPTGYAYSNITIPANASTNLYNFSVYQQNSINITFRDEENNQRINTTTVFFEIISDVFSNNYTTTNGTLYLSLLTPTTYTLRYTAAGYLYRFYEFTLNNNTYNELTLTLLNASTGTNITIIVYDEISNTVSNATVKVLKYNIATNTYEVNQIQQTNFNGQTTATVELNNEYYKFIVEYEGQQLLLTDPSYIYGTTVELTVILQSAGLTEYFSYSKINGTISYNNNTRVATFTYSDASNTLTGGCLQAYRVQSGIQTLYNQTCSTAAAASILMSLENSTQYYYLLTGNVTSGSSSYILASKFVRFTTSIPESTKKTGLFILFLLLCVAGFVSRYSIEGSLVIAGLSFVLTSAVGITGIPLAASVLVLVMCAIGAGIVGWRS